MNFDDFFKIVEISDREKEVALFYLEKRGIHEHVFVANYLQSLKSESVTYSEVATAFRYDKRIRRIIYKFIGFFEEYIRAYIVNHYENNMVKIKLTKELKESLKVNVDFYQAVNSLTFGQLINQLKILNEEDLKSIFETKGVLKKNLSAIVALRNETNHNRFLLHNRGLLNCTIGSSSSSSLWANVMNLAYLLPKDYSESFKKEIRDAQTQGKIKRENQTEWKLLSSIILDIEN